MTDSIRSFLKQEAAETFRNYRPLLTEAQGVTEVAIGVGGAVYSIFKAFSNAPSLQASPIEPLKLWGTLTVSGCIKLTVPITLYSSRFLYRAWKN